MSRGTPKDVASVVAAAGELVGRTRLQKTGVLLELAGVGFGFSYDYHLFGPYSDELVEALDRAVALGYVKEIVKRARWGALYSVFQAHQHPSDSRARDELIRIAKDTDSIILELAATAAFLASNGEVHPWEEVAHRKPEKVTRARMSQAKALYRRLAAVATPTPLPAIA
jgi:uncharacterized protein